MSVLMNENLQDSFYVIVSARYIIQNEGRICSRKWKINIRLSVVSLINNFTKVKVKTLNI